ncbi:MAG: peroxidase family protein [Salinisphaeraceae bacterium]
MDAGYRRWWVAAGLLMAHAACGGGGGQDSTSAPEPQPEFRSLSGAGNNAESPAVGRADTPMARMAHPAYPDGLAEPSGIDRPNPRTVSNIVARQSGNRPNARGASDFLWQWGQFLDHDLTLAREQADAPLPIPVPPGDEHFDPTGSGAVEIPFDRSEYDPETGQADPRQQMNSLTAYVDASQVYGSDEHRAQALRRNDGSGKLRTSEGALLPLNTTGLENNPDSDDPSLFVAGDIRANEQVALTAMHVLFVREHNRLADRLRSADASLSGDAVYQHARAIVIAKMQRITYDEFLPLLLGEDALSEYDGYEPDTEARLANEFATVAFRLGHSLLSSTLRRVGPDGQTIAAGDLPLRDAFFFPPERLRTEGGIEPLLRGLAGQPAQALDPLVVDDVRNFLFGPPGDGGRDLIALNLQRARDHGLPAYNELRRSLGLTAKATFADISSDPEIRARLLEAYDSVELIDPWIGCMAEDHLPGAMVGELAFSILKHQFEALRDGDRFWYERLDAATYTELGVEEIERASLAQVIRDNTAIGDEIPDNVFRVSP